MKINMLKLFILALLSVSIIACGGKKEETQPETTPQEQVEQAIEEVKEDVQQAADSIVPEVEKAVEEVKEEVKKATSSNDFSTQPMNAYVVSLNEVAAGKDGKVSKSTALDLLSKNQILAVKNKDNGNVYLVYHSNGTFAGKDLANMADVEIGILGKAKKVNGVNVIMAEKIRPMR